MAACSWSPCQEKMRVSNHENTAKKDIKIDGERIHMG